MNRFLSVIVALLVLAPISAWAIVWSGGYFAVTSVQRNDTDIYTGTDLEGATVIGYNKTCDANQGTSWFISKDRANQDQMERLVVTAMLSGRGVSFGYSKSASTEGCSIYAVVLGDPP